MPFYLLFTLAAIWLAPATAGAGDVLHAVSPNLIQRILSGEGGEAEVAETEADTTVEGLIDGKAYSVLFYECDGGAFDAPATPMSACLGYEYRAYFTDFLTLLQLLSFTDIDLREVQIGAI